MEGRKGNLKEGSKEYKEGIIEGGRNNQRRKIRKKEEKKAGREDG